MQTSHFLPLSVKSESSGLVEGYASTWQTIDSYGDTVLPGAFSRSLSKRSDIPMLWAHDQAQPVGRWLEIREDQNGLFVRGKLNLETEAGREAYAHLKAGDISGFSIGFLIQENGAEVRNGSRYLKEIDLLEISLVSIPANDAARVTQVKSMKPQTLREFEAVLRDAGFSRKEATAIAIQGFAGKDSGPDAALEIQAAAKHISTLAKLLQPAVIR